MPESSSINLDRNSQYYTDNMDVAAVMLCEGYQLDSVDRSPKPPYGGRWIFFVDYHIGLDLANSYYAHGCQVDPLALAEHRSNLRVGYSKLFGKLGN